MGKAPARSRSQQLTVPSETELSSESASWKDCSRTWELWSSGVCLTHSCNLQEVINTQDVLKVWRPVFCCSYVWAGIIPTLSKCRETCLGWNSHQGDDVGSLRRVEKSSQPTELQLRVANGSPKKEAFHGPAEHPQLHAHNHKAPIFKDQKEAVSATNIFYLPRPLSMILPFLHTTEHVIALFWGLSYIFISYFSSHSRILFMYFFHSREKFFP